MWAWLGAFLFTQVVECPIYARALRDVERRRWLRLLVAWGASTITHPIVWFLIPELWLQSGRAGGYWGMVVVAEAFAIAVEALYLWGFGVRRAMAWALGANLASVCLGLLSRHLFGWP